MSPRTDEQFEEIREQKKQLIMNTALELFATNGYHSTSIRQITEKAGISKGLIYNYYESKEELLKAIVEKGIRQFMKPFDPNEDGILTEEEFVYYIDEIFRMMENDPGFYKLYFSLLLQPGIFEKFFLKIKEMIAQFSNLLIPFFKQKGIDDPEHETMFLGALLDGLGFYYVSNPPGFPIEIMKRKIFKLYHINPKIYEP